MKRSIFSNDLSAQIVNFDTKITVSSQRKNPESFACDPMALPLFLSLAQLAISSGGDNNLPEVEHALRCLPFMHRESQLILLEVVKRSSSVGISSNLEFGYKDKAFMDGFY